MLHITEPPDRPGAMAGAFLTIKEVAARWKTSGRNVTRLIARGDLPAHKIGRLIRISMKDILVFEAQHRLPG